MMKSNAELIPVPIPDYLPTTGAGTPAKMAEMTLDLYRQVAEAQRQIKDAEREAQERIHAHRQDMDRVIAELAIQSLEFERLKQRVKTACEDDPLPLVMHLLELHSRRWQVVLQRTQVRVRDLTGDELTDELADIVEVRGAIPDATTQTTVIRDTLEPLVMHLERVVGTAKVITSVPEAEDEDATPQPSS